MDLSHLQVRNFQINLSLLSVLDLLDRFWFHLENLFPLNEPTDEHFISTCLTGFHFNNCFNILKMFREKFLLFLPSSPMKHVTNPQIHLVTLLGTDPSVELGLNVGLSLAMEYFYIVVLILLLKWNICYILNMLFLYTQ